MSTNSERLKKFLKLMHEHSENPNVKKILDAVGDDEEMQIALGLIAVLLFSGFPEIFIETFTKSIGNIKVMHLVIDKDEDVR